MSNDYFEKLKDPRWQKRRLEMLQAAGWTCEECDTKTETLHVHHTYYEKGKEPWESQDRFLLVVCESCHEDRHCLEDDLRMMMSQLTNEQLQQTGNHLSGTVEENQKSGLKKQPPF